METTTIIRTDNANRRQITCEEKAIRRAAGLNGGSILQAAVKTKPWCETDRLP